MKQLIIFTLLFSPLMGAAQVSGNVNYNSPNNPYQYPKKIQDVQFTSHDELVINIRGLNNVKADTYVAIFSTTQSGETAEETNNLMNTRLNAIKAAVEKIKPGTEVFTDMVSFVPVYAYETERKLFSKKSYNEIPAGFELQKNLHIKYNDPGFLSDLIAICATSEVYDLVRVDYASTKLDALKTEMMKKAKTLIKEKQAYYEALTGSAFAEFDMQVVDNFDVFYPVENYQSYYAYSSSSLNLSRAANVNSANKKQTLFYQPLVDKQFDFVLNPVITEPVIQLVYQVKVKVKLQPKTTPPLAEKEYLMISPSGDLKKLQIQN